MPTVPLVPQVSQTATDTPAVQAPGVEPMQNFAPQQIEQLGQAMQRTGSVATQIGNRIQTQLDDANVKAAETKFLRQSMDVLHGENGYLQKQGADALNSYDDAAQAVNKAKQDILDSLGNGVQKRMFDRVASHHLATFGAQMGTHRAQQRTAYTANESLARSENYRSLYNSVPVGSPEQGQYASVGVEERLNALAAHGVPRDSEQAKDAARNYQTDLIGDSVMRLLQAHNYEAAKMYFADHAADVDQASPKMQHIKGMIEDSALANKVQTVVGNVIAKGGTFEEQDQQLQQEFQGNPEGLKESRTEHGYRYQVHEAGLKKAEEDTFGQLWGMAFPIGSDQKRVPMSQLVLTSQFQSLDGKQRAALKAQFEAYAKRNDNDPEAQAQQTAQRYLNYYNVVNQRDAGGNPVYPTLSDNQIMSKMGALGPQLTVQLIKDVKEFRLTPAKIQQVEIDHSQLEARAKDYGLIKGDKPTDAEKMRLADLQTRLKIIQQESGQKWSYENTDKLIRQMLAPIVTSRSSIFPDTKKPFYEVQVTESVPQSFINSVGQKYRERGQQPPSPAELYQLWFDAKGKGLVDANGNVATPGNNSGTTYNESGS